MITNTQKIKILLYQEYIIVRDSCIEKEARGGMVTNDNHSSSFSNMAGTLTKRSSCSYSTVHVNVIHYMFRNLM